MILSLIFRQIVGIIQFSFVPLALYLCMPAFMEQGVGAIFCALGMGVYIGLVQYFNARNVQSKLQFEPNEKNRKYFEGQIEEVGMQPSQVNLRYAYNDDALGLTLFNTIMIDQMMWKGIENDDAFINAQKVIEVHIVPTLSAAKKKFHEQINKALTEPVQRFIFKHELGHAKDYYSYKKIIIMGFCAFLMALTTLCGVTLFLPYYHGVVVYVGAVLYAALVDLLLLWSSNILFKVHKEKECDVFATQYCTKEEIYAAADFFERYEQYAKEFRKDSGQTFGDWAPKFFMGYYPGNERAAYLRALARANS